MTPSPDFETYLKSKKIDSAGFRKSEPASWESWQRDFSQMHPNSFTVQKLNLINPVRRKYPLQEVSPEGSDERDVSPAAPPSPPKPGRPVIKPRPKIG